VKIPLPLLLSALSLLAAAAPAQSHTAQTVPVILLSDIHLDPFHDPAKLSQLRSAPVTGWAAILNAPPSPHQADDFAKLQSTCGAKGIDTPPAVLESSLHAELKQQPSPLFVTVSTTSTAVSTTSRPTLPKPTTPPSPQRPSPTSPFGCTRPFPTLPSTSPSATTTPAARTITKTPTAPSSTPMHRASQPTP
jgi:hypothetical protein